MLAWDGGLQMEDVDCFLNIESEVGALQTILLHRPGLELEQLMPKYLDEMLFEDIPYLHQMQEEHDFFAGQLRSHGVEVLYYEELLKESLHDEDGRTALIETVLEESSINSKPLKSELQEFLLSKNAKDLASLFLSGLTKTDAPGANNRSRLAFHIRERYPFCIDPLPNLYFSRDYGTVIKNRLSVNTMKTRARRRESLLLEYITEHHPRFRRENVQLWHRYNEKDSIEGGDILILSPSVLAIGCSARTSPEGIETMAQRLFAEECGIKEILVFQIPFARAYMHLDTVFTMVDVDKFSIYPGISNHIRIFRISPGHKNFLKIAEASTITRVLKKSLRIPAVNMIETGGGDLFTAEREQWNDGTNTLAIAPGKVVTYRRNRISNDILRKNGVDVVEIPGSELVRGRGGPRCMSMPLRRKPI